MDPLQYTSLCFILIVYKAFMSNHIFMSVLWSLLTMTSFFYHGNRDNKIYYWSDQIIIYMIVLICILYLFRTNLSISIIIVLSFIIVIYTYILELRLIKNEESQVLESLKDKSYQHHICIHFISIISFFIIFHFTEPISFKKLLFSKIRK